MHEIKKDFVHLHVHSEFSLQDSLLHVNDVVSLAKASGMWAAALTDMHNFFGAVKFYQAACKVGIKPIIGCQVRMLDDVTTDTESASYGMGYQLLLLCQNNQGYKHLCQLLTDSYQADRHKEHAVVLQSALTPQMCEGLLAIEPGLLGYSACSRLSSVDALRFWHTLFPDRYYFGLHRNGLVEEMQWERHLALLLSDQPMPLVALGGVCFAKSSDFDAHEVRVCIQAGQVLDSRMSSEYTSKQFWRSQEDMCEQFSDLPSAIENTLVIAKRCTVTWRFDQTFLPDFPVPETFVLDSYLKKQVQDGFALRGLDQENQRIYQERVDVELGIINRMGFAGYFLIVADFIQWSKNNQIPVGPGRGSGAGSLVAYCLGITDIDPIIHGLLFERFLNPERVSMPDFDVDFCMLNRDKVIQYVSRKYGRASVAQIITHGSMAAKASVRDVGRVLSHPYGFVDKLAKMIPLDLGITLPDALKQSPELAAKYQEDHEVKALMDMALTLEGCVRNVGRHAGGVVISPGPLTDFCALYAEDKDSQQVTHLDMGDVERIGLVKFDFLGLRTLTIIDQAVQWIVESGLVSSLDINAISLEDEKTFQLLKSGKTTAVFQLESRGFQELITRLCPDVFADIVALVALYRPGPLQSGMVDDFIERKHGRAEVVYAHPSLETLLNETYGVIVYQEQVMQIAQAMAGYTLGGADLLRRAMGKKKPEEMAKQREIFLKGSIEKGVSAETAEYVFDLMEKFAGYGFNKSHSVAYAFISYQTAYLKAHYIDYFMASVLSSDMDNTDKIVFYMEDCVQHGVLVLPPCVHASQWHFAVEKKKVIRYALGAIKGVGEGMARAICDEVRALGVFKDMLQFSIRMQDKVNKKVLEALISAGALDCLGQDRGVMLGSIEKILAQRDQYFKSKKIGQGDLFARASDHALQACSYGLVCPDWSLKRKLELEKISLGRYFSGHPLDPYAKEMVGIAVVPLHRLEASKKVLCVAGIVSRSKRMSTKTGRAFMLVEIADKKGTLEVACFDDKLVQMQKALDEHQVVVLEGVYAAPRMGNGPCRFQLQRVRSLLQWRREKTMTISVVLHANALDARVDELIGFFKRLPKGSMRICFAYRAGSAQIPLVAEQGSSCLVDMDNDAMLELAKVLDGHDYAIGYN